METGSEGHARIELHNDLVWRWVVLMPGCFHQHTASDAMDAVVFFPGAGPVLLRAFGDAQIADRAEPAEVPERVLDVVDYSRCDIGRVEEGPDDNWPRRIDGEIVAVRVLSERLLDGHALIESVCGKELRDGFDRFAVARHRQLQPATTGGFCGHGQTTESSPTFRPRAKPLILARRPTIEPSTRASLICACSSMMQSRTMLSRTVTQEPMLANGPTTECSMMASSATNDGAMITEPFRALTSRFCRCSRKRLVLSNVSAFPQSSHSVTGNGITLAPASIISWMASAMKYSFLRERPRRICSSIAA